MPPLKSATIAMRANYEVDAHPQVEVYFVATWTDGKVKVKIDFVTVNGKTIIDSGPEIQPSAESRLADSSTPMRAGKRLASILLADLMEEKFSVVGHGRVGEMVTDLHSSGSAVRVETKGADGLTVSVLITTGAGALNEGLSDSVTVRGTQPEWSTDVSL